MTKKTECLNGRINDKKCLVEKKYSELSAFEKTELCIEVFKTKWGKWTLRITSWSIAIVFVLGTYAEVTAVGKFDIFKILSNWVGFVLGIIATLFSIISMFLSFYNLEKEREAKKENEQLLKEVTDKIRESLINVNELLIRNQDQLLTNIKILEKKTEDAIFTNTTRQPETKSESYKDVNSFDIKLGDDKNEI